MKGRTNEYFPCQQDAMADPAELWEHKGMLVWTPALIGIAMTVLGALMTIGTIAKTKMRTALIVNGEEVSWSTVFNTRTFGPRRTEIIDAVANNYTYAAAPLFLALGFLVFFYCLSALHDDRRDRSVLFWKSLPISDAQTCCRKRPSPCCRPRRALRQPDFLA